MNHTRMLGLDVGSRRTGVAVSEGAVAVPLTIIEDESRNTVIARVLVLAEEQHARAIVVGLPVSLSGEEHAQAKRTRSFGDALARATPLPIVYQDEVLSTADVAGSAGRRTRSRTPEAVHPARRRGPARVDDLAAAVILQRYIDEHDGAPPAPDDRAEQPR
jgi:putative Holliday junction resolvase